MSQNELGASPFTRYRQGYEDGYHGKEKVFPGNSDYMMGFEQGKEDDLGALPPKFE